MLWQVKLHRPQSRNKAKSWNKNIETLFRCFFFFFAYNRYTFAVCVRVHVVCWYWILNIGSQSQAINSGVMLHARISLGSYMLRQIVCVCVLIVRSNARFRCHLWVFRFFLRVNPETQLLLDQTFRLRYAVCMGKFILGLSWLNKYLVRKQSVWHVLITCICW